MHHYTTVCPIFLAWSALIMLFNNAQRMKIPFKPIEIEFCNYDEYGQTRAAAGGQTQGRTKPVFKAAFGFSTHHVDDISVFSLHNRFSLGGAAVKRGEKKSLLRCRSISTSQTLPYSLTYSLTDWPTLPSRMSRHPIVYATSLNAVDSL